MCYISHIVIFISFVSILYSDCVYFIVLRTYSYLVGIVGTDSYFFHCGHVETMVGTYYLVGFVGSKCFG